MALWPHIYLLKWLTFGQTFFLCLTIIGTYTARSGNISGFKIGSRILGAPLQFVVVTVVSVVLFVYISAAAATLQIEERSDNIAGSVNKQRWEQAALWACPLH